jgi:hypothetical protein
MPRAAAAVRRYERAIDTDAEVPSTSEIRLELRGVNLVCWCPLDQPCHADVLIKIANGVGDPSR